MIPYGKHVIGDDDVEAVVDVLKHHFLTQGNKVQEFEKSLTNNTGAKYCVAVNSGTSALHIACLALDLGQGDLLWTSPNSFVASSNCALYCGAEVDFVDICPNSKNICPKLLDEKLAQANAKGRLPKILTVVHFGGLSCEMRKIGALCHKYGVSIIEDASHALGGTYLDNKVGSCQFSDITVLSFHPVKSITTAEGGAALTNNPELADLLQMYGKHGITRDTGKLQKDSPGGWYYEQQFLGYNYRLSDLHSVLGITQIAKLDEFVSKRTTLAQRYFSLLRDLPLRLPWQYEEAKSAWHLFVIEVLQHRRSDVFSYLRDNGVGANVHYIPIHTQPYYQQLGFAWGDFPNAENYYNNAITIPLHPLLSESEQDKVVGLLRDCLV